MSKSNQVEIPKERVACVNFCDGEWAKPSGATFQILSPYSGALIGEGYESSEQDLNAVVQAAVKAQREWGRAPLKERVQVLFDLRAILKRDITKISHRISSECGKTLGEAEAEILKGIEVTEFALSLQNLDIGGRLEVSRGIFCEYRREPLGVVAGVTPFNFPAMVPMWMIPIAIALGNSFIWKPSDKTPLTSLLLAEAFREAGLPHGVFSVVQGGRATVEAILDHSDIQAIGFVGSTNVAREIYRRGSKNLKRVLALGGAKNHIFLMPDADPALTAKGVADSFTGCAGQRCMAASVLCAIATNEAEKKSIDKLIENICEQAKTITVGDKMGAIISADSLKRLESAIALAEEDGAKIILDGRKPTAPKNLGGGYWLAPTVLDHVRPGSEAATEELFGPVLSIVRCKSLSEALEIQNKSKYGNAVSVFTQNGGVADEVSRYGKAGMVGINIGVPVPREPFSFGGVFDSKYGHGDITGAHSLDFWSNVKKVTTKWAVQKDWSWMG
jgi:malonate-semialdehyde dehydrogenase (acetylating) / methylmalonate-semialdehyde dehydrogenase